ncbi:UNVERIFIED_CONTAM: hypothetical protein Slati_3005900 [Sesamum latifolium]|uniref:Uncharacterized protein n=1 Tax=Sesamum latifolium TaxID=2727402 RepID=A0AAW2VIZ2_9LAMI
MEISERWPRDLVAGDVGDDARGAGGWRWGCGRRRWVGGRTALGQRATAAGLRAMAVHATTAHQSGEGGRCSLKWRGG